MQDAAVSPPEPEASKSEDPIMLNFEDFEDKSKRFIDPAQLENFNGTEELQLEGGGGGEEKAANESLTQADNPHGDKQFCVDISEYLDLKWVVKDSEECHVTFTR